MLTNSIFLLPTNGKGPRKQECPDKQPHIGLLVNQPQTAWESFGQCTQGRYLSSRGAYIKRWTSVLLLSNYCVRYKLMKGLYYPVISADNAPPHSGHYTLLYTAATKSWKDLLRGICSQYFHCQQVHLWKVNECVFFTSPNFSANWGLSWKVTKSCSKPYSTKIVWKERFFVVATFHWNLKLQLTPKDLSCIGIKGSFSSSRKSSMMCN